MKHIEQNPDTSSLQLPKYEIDTRPLCQGMPFLLTDAAHPRSVLKNGSHFLVLDRTGSIPACNTLGYGYYRYDTRQISQWEFTLDQTPLSLLSSSIEKGYMGNFLYTNGQIESLHNGAIDLIAQHKIIVTREIVLGERLWEQICFESLHNEPITVDFTINFQSDFADMFEVRGLNRPARGQRMLPAQDKSGRAIFLAYNGLDGILLETVIEFTGILPTQIRGGEVTFRLLLPPHEQKKLELCITTRWGGQIVASNPCKTSFEQARKSVDQEYQDWRSGLAKVETSHELLNLCLNRGIRDLFILRQPTPKGYGIAAGIPWYTACFGRDSAIVAWQMLPFAPNLAKDCIEVLAAYQGQEENDYKDESPGKIMHELRLGELARTNQIPHSPYYGTVDATQLWLYLLSQYVFWTGDLEFAHKLWPNVNHALTYLDQACQNTYITYQRRSSQGLENQGWKDSGDSVMHESGALAEPPIAICEAQSYLYACRLELAKVADLIEQKTAASKLRKDAYRLKRHFQKDFWMEDHNYLALAVDGQGKQVKTIASNAGHCLFSGILDDDKAKLVAKRLLDGNLNGGWGIRTLSNTTVAYSPISYHNGTVWPHDNAIIVEGLRKIGRLDDMHKIMRAIQEVAEHEPDYRLPELYCGFDKSDAVRPIDYPVSCSPQAWAAGSLFQMLRSCLNLQADAPHNRLSIIEPYLPEWLNKVTISGLKIGNATVDLSFNTSQGSTYCQILKRTGDIKVIIES
jgi:glycogen debranching enzyme